MNNAEFNLETLPISSAEASENSIEFHAPKLYEELCEFSRLDPVYHTPPLEMFEYDEALSEASIQERIVVAVNVLLNVIEQTTQRVEKLDRALLDFHIARLDTLLGEQLDMIMHDPNFQEIEAAWRGLKFLVDRTDFNGVIIDLIDITKQALQDDFEQTTEITQSGLYQQTYVQEYDTPGGEPFGAIISNFEFDNSPQDIALLRALSIVSAASHAPFIASVGARFFGKSSMEEVAAIQDITSHFARAEYIKWNRFRELETARYIGLILPRFLARLPYGHNGIALRAFNYSEQVKGEDASHYLWANAAFVFATNLVRSFSQSGWCVQIRGPQGGGLVEDLPLHFYDLGAGSEAKIPTEVLIPETREYEFAQLGFIPLSFYKNKDYACFFSAHSSQKPAHFDTKQATANSSINTRLPYIFLLSRIAHYLKIIQRENIGVVKDGRLLERELNHWIKHLVTEMAEPSIELQASHPLRHARVQIEELEDSPGFFCLKLFIVPHFQLEGMDVSLSLVSQLPRAKN